MLVQLTRTLILFALIIFAVRLMGKRAIGELQASELVVTMMLANLAAVPMQDIDIPLAAGIIPIAVLSSVEVLLSVLMLKWKGLARLISGEPVVIIRDGRPVQKALRQLRMTNADMFEELRKDGIFNIGDVCVAVVETDGTVSVMKNASAELPTAADTGTPVTGGSLCVPVISDGLTDTNALGMIGWDSARLERAVKACGVPVEDIFLLTACGDGSYKVIKKENDN